jgi:hypothetical protein
VNRDPIQERGGLNLFEFVNSNPLGWVDLFGFGSVTVGEGPCKDKFQIALDKVKKTKRGKQLIKKIEASEKDILIVAVSEKCAARGEFGYDDKCGIIGLPPKGGPKVTTSKGDEPASDASMIAHELGHAAGYEDDGPGRMNNINANENPVRKELGEPERTKYALPAKP